MAFTLKNLVTGNESFMPVLEEDGSSVSIEQTIEVETAAAEEAGEVEEVTEEIETSDEEGDTAEEAAELYAKLDYLMDVNATYGLSQPVVAALDFNGELTALVPNLPALESLSMAASPNDSASVIAQEGFKEAMKSFWEWVKKIARKVRDTVVALASRVAGLFTRLDATAKRLAKAIGDSDINMEKLKDKKVKLMHRDKWMNLAGVITGSEPELNKIIDSVKKAVESGVKPGENPLSGLMSKFGITTDENGSVSKNDIAKDLFKTTENTVAGHGWNKKDCSDTTGIAKIYGMARTFPGIASKVKAVASTLESTAARAEKMTVVGYSPDDKKKESKASETKSAREGARAAVKMLTQLQKGVNMVAKASFQLIREFIKAQRAVYACRGNYDVPGKDKK